MRAVVIERSKLMRILLRRILVRRGFEVVEAATSRELKGPAQDAEIVLIEWDLRGLEVPAFISRVRRDWATRSLFVVLAGSEPEPRMALQVRMAGADHILVKPFTSAQLDAALLDSLFPGVQLPNAHADFSPGAAPRSISKNSHSVQAILWSEPMAKPPAIDHSCRAKCH